jgi:hypothetical protein
VIGWRVGYSKDIFLLHAKVASSAAARLKEPIFLSVLNLLITLFFLTSLPWLL